MSSYTTISPDKLSKLIGTANTPALIDVRTDEDFTADPRLIPGAVRRSHEEAADWGEEFSGRPAIVVCLRGQKLAQGTAAWWLESRTFFGGLRRERIWVFWRRVLHTCHHRTQVQTWLRLAGHEPVPAIYGPSGDVKWDEADPTYSLEAAKRGG